MRPGRNCTRLGALLAACVAAGALSGCRSDKTAEKPDAATGDGAQAGSTGSASTRGSDPRADESAPADRPAPTGPSAVADSARPDASPDIRPLGKRAEVAAPTTNARFLLPPKNAGDAVAHLQGCLAVANPSEADAAAHPVPEPQATRGPAPAEVVVAATGGGIVVEHKLKHACCLKGEVSTAVEGRTVTITEALDGKPCRCMCGSTVRTAVGLDPGDYVVKVVVAEPGVDPKIAGEKSITVK